MPIVRCMLASPLRRSNITTSNNVRRSGVGKGVVAKPFDRVEGDLIAFDPLTGEIKKKAHWPYAGHAGTVTTAGGLIFTGFADGTFAAFDDETMELRWKIKMGAGFTAPPISFGVNGKQYIAIAT